MKRTYEIAIITLLFFVIGFLYHGQQRISHNNGQGWDGFYYYKIAEQIQQDKAVIAGDIPFIKRIGTLYLVGSYSKLKGNNLLDSAMLVNLAGALITVILLIFWLRIFIDTWWIRGILLLLFMLDWQAPLRFSFFYPLTTDSWGMVWFLCGLLILHSIRKLHEQDKSILWQVLALSCVIAIGNLFRESITVLGIALFFIYNPLQNPGLSLKNMTISHGIKLIQKTWTLYFHPKTLIFFLPFLFTALLNFIISRFTVITDEAHYSYLKSAFLWFYIKSLPAYLLGIFNAYGPVVLLVPFFYKEYISLFYKRQEFLFLGMIALLFGFIGGSDTERILFTSSFPIVFILIGIAIKSIFYSKQRWWLFILFALQTIAYRFYWATPDYPNNTEHIPIPFISLIGSNFKYKYLTAVYGNYFLNSALFIQYLILFAATFYILQNKTELASFRSDKKNE